MFEALSKKIDSIQLINDESSHIVPEQRNINNGTAAPAALSAR